MDFIATTVRERGYPPTVREIGEAVGLRPPRASTRSSPTSSAGASDQVPDQAPGHDASDANRVEGVVVPLLGRIAAGTPVLADQNVEDHLVVPMGYAGDAEHFALSVTGDSMVDAGILDGDVVTSGARGPPRTATWSRRCSPGPPRTRPRSSACAAGAARSSSSRRTWRWSVDMDPDGRIIGKVVAVLRKL